MQKRDFCSPSFRGGKKRLSGDVKKCAFFYSVRNLESVGKDRLVRVIPGNGIRVRTRYLSLTAFYLIIIVRKKPQRENQMQRQNIITHTEVSTTVAAQLAGSSLLAGGAALIVFYWLHSVGFTLMFASIFALAGSVGVGLLATANLQYGMFLLCLSLTRIAEGRSASVQQSFWLWPLRALFQALAKTSLKIDEISQRERLANEYYEQLLQQTSQAAAAEERNHLARDLHDSIKQQIFSIRMSAIAAKGHMQIGVTKAQEALEDILKSTNEAQVEMQALLQQLRSAPLENMSLAEAIQTQAQALEYRSGALVSVEAADLPAGNCCPPHMQEALFRIVQEAFANIARHARACAGLVKRARAGRLEKRFRRRAIAAACPFGLFAR